MQEQLDAFTLVEEPNCPKCGWNAVLLQNFYVPLAVELNEEKKRQTFGVSEIFLLYLLAHRSTSGLSSLKDAPSLGNSGLGSLKGVPPLPGMNNNNNSRGRSTALHSFSWACCQIIVPLTLRPDHGKLDAV